MRKLFSALAVLSLAAVAALGQQSAPTLRIVSEDGNRLPSELMYGNTRVKPLRLRPGTNTPITIDDADFFVQQQYVDFLSRFPDQAGFQFWMGQINNCGPDTTCVGFQRDNTSGAFFLSIEFRGTGYYVYRLQRASFGTLPTYASFMPDTRAVGNGVIIGEPGAEQKLDANKASFTSTWVTRPSFLASFPTSMTPAEYVDKLVQRAGVSPESVNRNALVSELAANNTTAGRASVLRKIVESAAFDQKEKNPAFVFMQYVGYLRRDPDPEGFAFWLKKLNDHGGDFHEAQMVRSFLVSGEYRSRF
ncbi:MAG TPA: DUF4214 domain-containing protein [Pyrinomonadaceae bacterium]|nr:DUF4214 domain-containing protein [Pyrinomonadaceae bacterium]